MLLRLVFEEPKEEKFEQAGDCARMRAIDANGGAVMSF